MRCVSHSLQVNSDHVLYLNDLLPRLYSFVRWDVLFWVCLLKDKDVRLSKSLSYVLRHGAAKMGLHMSSGVFLIQQVPTECTVHSIIIGTLS